ncbi:hypothetical protein [Saccharothrix sp. Mg75]|uniref:hypothetical protein n=1 Tax=Saccharothrix sp. Mg75 TaxID=3445357 RepID=UPI003EEE6F26
MARDLGVNHKTLRNRIRLNDGQRTTGPGAAATATVPPSSSPADKNAAQAVPRAGENATSRARRPSTPQETRRRTASDSSPTADAAMARSGRARSSDRPVQPPPQEDHHHRTARHPVDHKRIAQVMRGIGQPGCGYATGTTAIKATDLPSTHYVGDTTYLPIAGVTRSMGAVGSSAVSAAAESLNASSKRELLQRAQTWDSEREVRLAVFD